MLKVAKFGGTSLCDAAQIKKVLNIINADQARRIIVVSAPGKRNSHDQKITDLFKEWHRLQTMELPTRIVSDVIFDRFDWIISGLGIDFDISEALKDIQNAIAGGASEDYAASRGEYLNGLIVAQALNCAFIDPADYLLFHPRGHYLSARQSLRNALLQHDRVVVPGFYGATAAREIKTFSRGGSDITGAIIAEAVSADVYENWTDVSGLLMADPRIVENPQGVASLSHRELRELTYMGANVFHEEATLPVRRAGIPINIKNTNEPEHSGTMVVSESTPETERLITGIAGRKNFSVITIEKTMMNQEIGFIRKILAVLESHGISIEHVPGGIDTVSIIVGNADLAEKTDEVVREINNVCQPESVTVQPNLAMIAIVGRNMIHTPGVAARVFTAIAKAGINTRLINQGSSELNIIVGVDNAMYEDTIRAIYAEFVK